MTNFPAFTLDAGWECFPTEDSAAYGLSRLDDEAWARLASLNEWPQQLLAFNDEVFIRHNIALEATDECVRYVLRVEGAPPRTGVYINGWHMGDASEGAPFERDVTNYVSLDDNVLLLKVRQAGSFGAVQWRAEPCPAAD